MGQAAVEAEKTRGGSVERRGVVDRVSRRRHARGRVQKEAGDSGTRITVPACAVAEPEDEEAVRSTEYEPGARPAVGQVTISPVRKVTPPFGGVIVQRKEMGGFPVALAASVTRCPMGTGVG